MKHVISPSHLLDLDDAELSGRVRAALARDAQVKTDDVQVSVEDGAVTLLGTVDAPYERARASARVAQLEGVRRVDNRLTVAVDQYLSDKDLLQRVQTALLADPHPAVRQVGARIHRGVVTLVGRVDSLEDERHALRVARGVKGVREVVSALKIGQIDPTHQPVPVVDDAALLSQASAAVAEAGVTIFENRSYVRDGVLHLRGLVRDRSDLARALAAAQRVPGLQAVRLELALQADPSSRDPDEALAGRVIQAFSWDGRVSPAQVVPTASEGVVVLSGQVDSIEDHDAAIEIAAKVPGVRGVLDSVRILGRGPLHATDHGAVLPRGTKFRHGGRRR